MSNKLKFSLLTIILFLGGVYFHTHFLSVSHYNVKLRDGQKKIKLAHITDLHSKSYGWLEKQVHSVLIEEKPDVIIITGDLATPSGSVEAYREVLKRLKAPLGVFFVHGNWEYWEPITELQSLLIEAGIKDLSNQTHHLDSDLWIVGFDDSEEGQPDLKILKNLPENSLKIGIFHSPHFFEKTAGLIELNFAGHSHGGQIKLPLMKPFWVPHGTGDYDQGWFELKNSKLFVSRGIGTSVLPLRFNCSPELALVDISY